MSNRKNLMLIILSIILIYAVIMGSIFGVEYYTKYIKNKGGTDLGLSVLENSPLKNLKLKDNKAIYANSGYEEVIPLYMTVYYGENPLGGNSFSLTDINNLTRAEVPNEPIVNVLVREGSPNGIEGKIGYNASTPNGRMEIRGASTRNAHQKSFKIKLFQNAGTFDGQAVLNLNKHPNDETRILNKLCFDFFTKLDNIAGIRTKFVHLYVMDKSKPNADTTYTDYGLFTQAEQPSNEFLEAHGLDKNGNLYKANSFEFYRYPNELKSSDDPTFKLEDFEKRLKVFAGKDHRKVVAMLEDINKNEIDINVAFNKYFDRDNYLTWVAINLLLGNLDTTTQNYLLYSPLNSYKWYFMPWDLDGSLKNTKLFINFFTNMPDSQKGLARYWSVNIHRRYFSYTENTNALTAKVLEVKKVFLENDFSAMALKYHSVVKSIIDNSDDKKHIATLAYQNTIPYMKEFNQIIEDNYHLYLNSLHIPMPNFLLSADNKDGKTVFKWSPSQDLDGGIVHYDFQIASDPYFKNIIVEQKDYYSTEYTLNNALSKGTYYWRVLIYDDKGNIQYPFNTIDITEDKIGYGLEVFNVS